MVYVHVDDYPDVNDDDVLWRYVDLTRYLDLLQTSELHLARADQMEDSWEGAFGEYTRKMGPVVYGEHWEQISRHFPTLYHWFRSHTYMNCWHVGAVESAAMWKIYVGDGKGIAIRTTAERLKAALVGPDHVTGAQVQYVDYSNTWIPHGNEFWALMHKRKSFAHEQEYRLMRSWSPEVYETDENNNVTRSAPDIPPPFLREPVNLKILVQAVYVAPDAVAWVESAIRKVTTTYAADIEVRRSDLGLGPVF